MTQATYTYTHVRLSARVLSREPRVRLILQLGEAYVPVTGWDLQPFTSKEGTIVAFPGIEEAIQVQRNDAESMHEEVNF